MQIAVPRCLIDRADRFVLASSPPPSPALRKSARVYGGVRIYGATESACVATSRHT